MGHMNLHPVEPRPLGPHRRSLEGFFEPLDFVKGQGAGKLVAFFVEPVGRCHRHIALD